MGTQTDRQTDRHTDRLYVVKDSHIDRQTDSRTDIEPGGRDGPTNIGIS